jgi:hypothetical protein
MELEHKDEIVAVIVDMIQTSFEDRECKMEVLLADGTLKLYEIAKLQANLLKNSNEDFAKSIVNEAFDEFFKDIFVNLCDLTLFNEEIVNRFEMIHDLSGMALLFGWKKMSAGKWGDAMLAYIRSKDQDRTPGEEASFAPADKIKEAQGLLHVAIGKMKFFMRTVSKYSQTEEWASDLFGLSIAVLLPYKFPWLLPSKASLAPFIEYWFDDKKASELFLNTAWRFLTDEPYYQLVAFPQTKTQTEIQLFPSEEWFKLIKFPKIRKPVSLENYETFLENACLSLHSKDTQELAPLPVGRLFVAYQKELLQHKSLSPSQVDHLKLKMICKLAMSQSNVLPLISLFSTTLNLMGELKMVKVSQDHKKTFKIDNTGTFYKRNIPFGTHLQFVLDYHLIFWRIFIDKETWNFQLPFFLFENLYMEIFAVTNFHVKELTSIVKLLDQIESIVLECVSKHLPEDRFWLTEYIMQAIAISANSLCQDVSTYISSLVSNEKMLHLYALMQGDNRCYFDKPCERETLFTYDDPLDINSNKGFSLRLNAHSFHSTSFMPTVAIPVMSYSSFETAIRRSVQHWASFHATKSLARHDEGLTFICDRIAEDIWFAQIAHRITVQDPNLYTQRVREIVSSILEVGSFSQTLLNAIMKGLDRILLDQVDEKQGTWKSQFILREYFSFYMNNVKSHTPKYEIAQILIVAQQYLGVYLKEYQDYQKKNTLQWTEIFLEDNQVSIKSSFDYLSVPDSLVNFDTSGTNAILSWIQLVRSNVFLANAMKELRSLEYRKYFPNEIPIQFIEYLKPILESYKEQWDFYSGDFINWMGYVETLLLGCYFSGDLTQVYLPFLNWVKSSPEQSEHFYEKLVNQPLIAKGTTLPPIVAEISRKLDDLGRSIKLPDTVDRIFQARIRFQNHLKLLVQKNECPHLLRFIMNEMKIEDAMKGFLLRPVSLRPPGTDIQDLLFFMEDKYMTTFPIFTHFITCRPFSAALRLKENQVLSEKAEKSKAAPKAICQAGFFNKSKGSNAPKLDFKETQSDFFGLMESVERIKDVIKKFDESSALLTRDEPLTSTEILGFENAVKNVVENKPNSYLDTFKNLDYQPEIYKSIMSSILKKITNQGQKNGDTPWFAQYQDPNTYENVFNGRNSAKYSKWRDYALKRCLKGESPSDPGSIQKLLTEKIRNETLVKEVKELFLSKKSEKEALIAVINLWDVRYHYEEPTSWSDSQLKSNIMKVVKGIQSSEDYETALFACTWPADKFEDFVQRVAYFRV